MNRIHCSTLAIALGALASIGSTKPAFAVQEIPQEYAIFLMDSTNSMVNPVDGQATPTTRWQYVINQAILAVNEAENGANGWTGGVSRGVAIWQFKLFEDMVTSGPVAVWPKTDADCTAVGLNWDKKTHTTTPPADDIYYCVFPADTPYTVLTKAKEQHGIFNELVASLGPTANLYANTPLAQSLCKIISEAYITGTDPLKTIVLESDGSEKTTPLSDPCYGPSVNPVDVNKVGPTYGPDWNFPTEAGTGALSWEAKIIRRLYKYTETNKDLWTTTQVPLNAPAPPGNISWRVSTLYNAYPTPIPGTSVAAASAMALSGVANDGGAERYSYAAAAGTSPSRIKSLAGSAVPAVSLEAMATSGMTYSIAPAELALFKGLGKANAKSRYVENVFDETNPPKYGVTPPHKTPGDVDDSGCVDRADYSMIMQKDIWLQKAVRPLELAVRADVNYDGWVNHGDRKVVIDNWGKGTYYGKCRNPPSGPKPVY